MVQLRWRQIIDVASAGPAGILSGATLDQGVSPASLTPANPFAEDIGGLEQAYRSLYPTAAPAGDFSLNLATGQNAAGVIQTAGDLADANWTVSNSANYKEAPIAFTVAPGDRDWYGNWAANGPNSSWIAADPDNSKNGNVTYTFTFNLNAFNPADAMLSGGQFLIDDGGTVSLNGHVLGSQAYGQFLRFTPLSNGEGDFVAGVNTLVIQTVGSDFYCEAARLEGTVVDTVQTGPPGPVHWANPVNGNFTKADDWVGGVVPAGDSDAILDAAGASPYTVFSSANQTVNSVQTAATGRLDITGGVFTATSGTGDGANAGSIRIEAGATLMTGGTLVNQGAVATGVNGASGTATIEIVQSTTLNGGGAVNLGHATTNEIVGFGAAASLANIDNTISGSGFIGGTTLAFVNEADGVVDANQSTSLTLDASAGAIGNAGLIETTGVGGLVLQNGSLHNSGQVANDGSGGMSLVSATIDDTSGGALSPGQLFTMTNSAILGGTLTLADGATMTANGEDNLTAALTNNGTIQVAADAALTLQGGAVNAGTIDLAGKGGLSVEDGSLVNSGLVRGESGHAVTIDGAIDNSGRIVAGPKVTLTIDGAVTGAGRLKVDGGTMTIDGAVTGGGTAIISGGTLEFTGASDERVDFRSTGQVVLVQSQGFAGSVGYFSEGGGTSLDLRDISFIDPGQATFSGGVHGGVLTVTDGTHTAEIKLNGDYRTASFVASGDGQGGTLVVAQATPIRFAAAMAALNGGSAQGPLSFHAAATPVAPALLRPAPVGG